MLGAANDFAGTTKVTQAAPFAFQDQYRECEKGGFKSTPALRKGKARGEHLCMDPYSAGPLLSSQNPARIPLDADLGPGRLLGEVVKAMHPSFGSVAALADQTAPPPTTSALSASAKSNIGRVPKSQGKKE